MCLHMLLLNESYELVSAELWILWTGVSACKTDKSMFLIILSTRTDAKKKKNTVLLARLQNEPYTSDIPVHSRWVVYSSSITPDFRPVHRILFHFCIRLLELFKLHLIISSVLEVFENAFFILLWGLIFV